MSQSWFLGAVKDPRTELWYPARVQAPPGGGYAAVLPPFARELSILLGVPPVGIPGGVPGVMSGMAGGYGAMAHGGAAAALPAPIGLQPGAAMAGGYGVMPPGAAMAGDPPQPLARASIAPGEVLPIAQAMMDLPNCNFIDWVNQNGGVFGDQGEGLDGLDFVLIGGGQANLYLSVLLKDAGANVTVLEARERLAGRAKCHEFFDGSKAAMGMMRYGRGQALWGNILKQLGFVLKSGFPDPGVAPTVIASTSAPLEAEETERAAFMMFFLLF